MCAVFHIFRALRAPGGITKTFATMLQGPKGIAIRVGTADVLINALTARLHFFARNTFALLTFRRAHAKRVLRCGVFHWATTLPRCTRRWHWTLRDRCTSSPRDVHWVMSLFHLLSRRTRFFTGFAPPRATNFPATAVSGSQVAFTRRNASQWMGSRNETEADCEDGWEHSVAGWVDDSIGVLELWLKNISFSPY